MTASLADVARPARSSDLAAAARKIAATAQARADTLDCDGAFPDEDIRDLFDTRLLHAPLPGSHGGIGLGLHGADTARDILVALGRGSLALGRLYEGHVNALALVARYGQVANIDLMRHEVSAGRPSGVWMAGEALRLQPDGPKRFVLRGRKILCSGAGHVRRPLVAADRPGGTIRGGTAVEGGSVMVIPFVDEGRADATAWTAQGMKATATGTVDFDGIAIGEAEIVGRPGDYLRAPYFRGGAWRVIAVQLGGLEAILDEYRRQLASGPNRDHPLHLARFGEAEIACETARLWVRQAALVAEAPGDDAAAVDAYVDLARNAFEATALRVVALAQKTIGLKAFLRPNPLERIVRDLTTYLRQPALDMSLLSAAAYRLRPRP